MGPAAPCPLYGVGGGARPYQPPTRGHRPRSGARRRACRAGRPICMCVCMPAPCHCCAIIKTLSPRAPDPKLCLLSPSPWAGGFALPAAGAWPAVGWAARVLRDPARAGCSCWHQGSLSQFVVPICAAPAEIGVSLPSPCPHSLLVPSPGLLCLGLRPHPIPAPLHPCHHRYPTELSAVGTPLTPQGPPVPSSSPHRCPQCP